MIVGKYNEPAGAYMPSILLTMNSQRRYYYPIYVSVSEMRSPLNQRLNTFTPLTEASHLLPRETYDEYRLRKYTYSQFKFLGRE